MSITASISPITRPEPGINLLFLSPDPQCAQRLAARLRDLATVQWENSRSFSAERWASLHQEKQLVLLDYTSDSAALSTDLAGQLLALTPGLPLFGVGSTTVDRAAGVLAALRAGVLDFVDMDASDDEIRVLLRHALQLLSVKPLATDQAPRRRGQLVLLMGTRPGVGTSTLASHLGALAMPEPSKAGEPAETDSPHALLLDLGQPAGDAALYLGVAGDFHYTEALRHAGRIDATLIRTALSRHASELVVLAQAADTVEPPVNTKEVGLLIERLLSIFDMVLCDVGGLPHQQIPTGLLRAADEIWLVTDQSIGSMVSLDACLRGLEQMQVRDQRLSLVITRHDPACGLSANQIADRFDIPLLARIPERGHVLRTSANQGLLLHQTAPRDPYIRALEPLLMRLRISKPRTAIRSPWQKLLLRARGL